MNVKSVFVISLLILVLLSLTIVPFPTTAASPSPRKGPRTDELMIYWYPNMSAVWGALKVGEIDMVSYEITRELYEDAIEDPNIVLAPVAHSGIYEFDVNNNLTIKSLPGKWSPTSVVSFRQALAHLVDKDKIVDEFCEGFAERIDQPVGAPYKGWMNESYIGGNYPYPYNPIAAAALLDENGFVQGPTANPYYDPEFLGSAEFIRTYPACFPVWFNCHVNETKTPNPPYNVIIPKCVCDGNPLKVYGKLEGAAFYKQLSEPTEYETEVLPDGCPPGESKIKVVVEVKLEHCSYICIEYYTTCPDAGSDLDPLHVCLRTDDRRRLYAGRDLYEKVRKLGIPVTPTEGDIGSIYDKVFGDRDYHIYTGGWSVGRFPPLYTNGLFSIDNWFPYGSNYVRPPILDNATCAAAPHPNFEEYIKAAYYPESYEDALEAHRNVMGLHTVYCVNIPLWSSRSYWAYSTDVLGVVNMDWFGPQNGYSFMNAYKTDGGALKVGLRHAAIAMNIIYSDWYYDSQNLERMYMWARISHSPYDLVTDQSGWVQDWHTGTWFDPEEGVNKTKLTRWFRKDAHWVKPVTGDQGPVVDAWDFLFSGFTEYAFEDAWYYDVWHDVHHFTVVDDFCIEIYFDKLSYWLTYLCNGAMIPRHVWLQDPLAVHTIERFHEGTNVTTPGVVPLAGKPVWFVSVIAEGAELEQFTEWNWVKGKLEIFADLPDCTDINVEYWAAGYATGYTPGNLPWETIFEGCGMYYAVDFDKEASIVELRRNPHYWMETPPLGEVDFIWKWGPRDGTRPAPDVPEGPRTGNYKIDIYDIVLACGAYGSTGTAVPSPKWLAGADIAPPGGKIDIYDIVTICAKYGTKFNHTP